MDIVTYLASFLKDVDPARLLNGINPHVLGLALLSAVGMFLVASNLGLLSGLKLPSFGLRNSKTLNIEDAMARLQGDESPAEITLLENLPLLDRVIGPLIRSIVWALPHNEDAWVENALDLLDYPSSIKTPADYYAARVILAMLGFGFGLLLSLTTSGDNGGSFLDLFIYPLVGGFLGYAIPRLMIGGKLTSRKEQMLFEAPYLFDRLSVAIIASRNSLLEAIKDLAADEEEGRRQRQAEIEFFMRTRLTDVTSVPEGGYLMREMRLVAERCTREQMPLGESFTRMAERNTDVPLIEQFCNRMIVLEPSGLNINDTLRAFGDRAAELVEDTIESRSTENTALMITPMLIALFGIALTVAAPSLKMLSQMF